MKTLCKTKTGGGGFAQGRDAVSMAVWNVTMSMVSMGMMSMDNMGSRRCMAGGQSRFSILRSK